MGREGEGAEGEGQEVMPCCLPACPGSLLYSCRWCNCLLLPANKHLVIDPPLSRDSIVNHSSTNHLSVFVSSLSMAWRHLPFVLQALA